MLDGYEQIREELESFGVRLYAGTVDCLEDTANVAESLGFPVAYGMTRTHGDAIGAWWDEGRDHIQPSEFVLTGDGKVMASTYSNSPLGRMDPQETLRLVKLVAS